MSRANPPRSRPTRGEDVAQNSRHEDSSSTDSDAVDAMPEGASKRSGHHRTTLPHRRSTAAPNHPDGLPCQISPSVPSLQRKLTVVPSELLSNASSSGAATAAPHPPPATTPVHPEQSLAQLGFQPDRVTNWTGIRQPPKTDLFELLRRLILDFEKTNVQIRIADTVYNCHMLVLQCYSEFFMDLTHEQHVILPADKVTPAAFFKVYEWMLSAEPIVQRDGILELFNAAQYLRIKGLVAQCWVCLDDDERFSEDAAFMLYLEARALGEGGNELIQRLMMNRVGKFFLTLVASREFVEFGAAEVCRLLQSNSIAVNAESEVLMAATRWLDWRWEERKGELLALMRCVRFGLMPPWQLVELKRNVDVREIRRFVECEEVQRMVDDALTYVTTKYWYVDHADTIQHYMERLQFTEPLERQWIRDPLWYDEFEPQNQMCVSYAAFLNYLARIRAMGSEHWRTLKFCDGNPHAISQSAQTLRAGRLASSVWNGVSEEEDGQQTATTINTDTTRTVDVVGDTVEKETS